MKKYLLYIALGAMVLAVLSDCGKSFEEKRRIDERSRRTDRRQDSLALKIATVPTMDGLPLFVAVDDSMFAKAGVDVRLRRRNAQIDCDTLIRGRHVEGIVSDLMRTERLRHRGLPVRYVAATNAYWLMIANRRSRVKEVGQLADKMVAVTRFSATDYLARAAIKAEKPKYDVFQVQINDVNIRLKMLINNEMDAVMLTEPQATAAKLYNNPVLSDSRDQHLDLGVIAFRESCWKDKRRRQQIETFLRVYDQACDSINKNGVTHYASVIKKYTGADYKTIHALPKLHYSHAQLPRPHDVEVARKRWN